MFKIIYQVKVFWVVILCSIVVGHKCFKGPCCLHLQGEVDAMGKKWPLHPEDGGSMDLEMIHHCCEKPQNSQNQTCFAHKPNSREYSSCL